ncbi:MAG: hypothetical protein ACOYVK_12850 [Bacillota bacterium]
MGTVRAFPERSEGPKGKRWNRPRGVAGALFTGLGPCPPSLAPG